MLHSWHPHPVVAIFVLFLPLAPSCAACFLPFLETAMVARLRCLCARVNDIAVTIVKELRRRQFPPVVDLASSSSSLRRATPAAPVPEQPCIPIQAIATMGSLTAMAPGNFQVCVTLNFASPPHNSSQAISQNQIHQDAALDVLWSMDPFSKDTKVQRDLRQKLMAIWTTHPNPHPGSLPGGVSIMRGR